MPLYSIKNPAQGTKVDEWSGKIATVKGAPPAPPPKKIPSWVWPLLIGGGAVVIGGIAHYVRKK